MPSRKCTVCGNRVEVPRRVSGDEPTQVKCGFCGATARLRFRRRNGNVGGLKGPFNAITLRFNRRKAR